MSVSLVAFVLCFNVVFQKDLKQDEEARPARRDRGRGRVQCVDTAFNSCSRSLGRKASFGCSFGCHDALLMAWS